MPFLNRIVRAISIPAVGLLRYAMTLALLCGVWWYDARLLNWAFKENLKIIDMLGNAIDTKGKVESLMHLLAVDKMLLFTEASVAVWLAGKITLTILRFMFGRRSTAVAVAAAKTSTATDPPNLAVRSTLAASASSPQQDVPRGR